MDNPGGPGPPTRVPVLRVADVRYFWQFLRPDRTRILGMFLLILLAGAITVSVALIPQFIGRLAAEGRQGALLTLLWVFLGLALVGAALVVVQGWLAASVSQRFTSRLRLAIFRKIGRMSRAAVSGRSVGSVAHQSSGDAAHVQEFLSEAVPRTAGSLIQLACIVVALFFVDRRYILYAVPLLLVAWVIARVVNGRLRRYARDAQQQSGGVMNQLIEGVGGHLDLVASGRFDKAATRFDGELTELRKTAVTMSVWGALGALVPRIAFILLIFGYYLSQTQATIGAAPTRGFGALMSVVMLLGLAQTEVMQISRFFTDASIAAPSFHELRRLLDAPTITDVPSGPPIERGDIRVRGVSFAFGPARILQDVSFDIPRGSFTAIVGQTGSGKTTMFHLLLRMLEPQQGAIEIGGIPFQSIPLEELRRAVGFIPQAPFIFTGSIRHNVCIGVRDEEVDEDRLLHAVREAQLERLIERKASEGGLDAPAIGLSGGERQRIALARIFLRDPIVVVCDEYTASIDNATAHLIHEAMARTFRGKTRVVITHQLHTIRGADQILVLDQGRIIDQGSHDDLLARPGLYAEMWDVQRLA